MPQAVSRLHLPADPQTNLESATKKYVDDNSGGGVAPAGSLMRTSSLNASNNQFLVPNLSLLADFDLRYTVGGVVRLTSGFRVPTAGLYRVTMFAPWSSNANGIRLLATRRNGTVASNTEVVHGFRQLSDPASNNQSNDTGSKVILLDANDEIELAVFQNSGGNLSILGASFSIEWFGGPVPSS